MKSKRIKDKGHKYKLKYKINGGSFTKKQLENSEWGACDAMLLASVIYPEDSSLSVMFIPLDGRNLDKNKNPQPLEDDEIFKIWFLLSNRLAQSKTIAEEKKEFCRLTHELISRTLSKSKLN